MTVLTQLQVDVGHLFFSLPESRGFLLAGAAGLVALSLTTRPTQDLDLFGSPGHGDVPAAARALTVACQARGWTVSRARDADTFVRLVVDAVDGSVLVDLAVDATPGRPPVATVVGPTLAPEDLVGRKVVALFDRAEARDFADVFVLAQRYGHDGLLALAHEVDPGFDRHVFAQMLSSLSRFEDDDLPVGDPHRLRRFFEEWRSVLLASHEGPQDPRSS